MEVAVDICRGVNESAGIGRYTKAVTHEMLQLTADDPAWRWFLYDTYLRGGDTKRQREAEIVGDRSIPVHHYALPGGLKDWLWETRYSLPDRWSPTSSVLFAPSYFELPLGTRKRSVVTIYDLTMALFPERFGAKLSAYLMRRTQAAVAKADAVITISQQTKRDLEKFTTVDESRVHVIPLAAESIFRPNPAIEREAIVLAVGTVEPRKNYVRVIQAFAQLPDAIRRTTRLVIIGSLGWNYQEVLAAIERESTRSNITHLGSVDDAELAQWYNKATCFIYPSLYEGFGLPPLEAMQSGLPVITSNQSSLPEVVGDAALTVDPTDQGALSVALQTMLSEPTLRARLSTQGIERAKQFSWTKNAQATLEVLEQVGK